VSLIVWSLDNSRLTDTVGGQFEAALKPVHTVAEK